MPDARRLSTIDILERLVSFDTTSCESNLPLIDWISGYLTAHGVPFRLSHDPTGLKANLHATIGPGLAGGIALSGHVDTVPVDGQRWNSDPFALRLADGRAYARGACDMKGFVASCLAAVPDIVAMDLRRPLHLFVSYDEEVDCGGARVLMEQARSDGSMPALCIVGEPSGMQPIVAHKGRLAVRVEVKGRPGHSSRPAEGVNAIHAAAEAIGWIGREAARLEREGRRVEGFLPAHSTIHVGLISGGTILNIIPEDASFEMEWRTVPGDDAFAELDRLRRHAAETIEPAMRHVSPEAGFRFLPLNELPPLAIEEDHPLVDLVRQCGGANATGKVGYGTEAGIFQQNGIASIVCGPGDIAQAHQPDEWIALDQLAACDRFVRRVADTLTRAA
ncbi:acetylornithine deacetylase [Rhizosaccharibacter radicis]|uniref:Acetylornithine deacetylase n=1 Tax=Rhizosaccharibacter radicis TaxID=2782605 RepID=A0ABT1VYL3_9PROT|nr:acetylornithine deacetylase [Acetobacteraceae bacterium KSS12]